MKYPKLRDRISSRGTGPVLFDISSLNTETECETRDNTYSSLTARGRHNQRVFGVGGEVRF